MQVESVAELHRRMPREIGVLQHEVETDSVQIGRRSGRGQLVRKREPYPRVDGVVAVHEVVGVEYHPLHVAFAVAHSERVNK